MFSKRGAVALTGEGRRLFPAINGRGMTSLLQGGRGRANEPVTPAWITDDGCAVSFSSETFASVFFGSTAPTSPLAQLISEELLRTPFLTVNEEACLQQQPLPLRRWKEALQEKVSFQQLTSSSAGGASQRWRSEITAQK